MLNVLGTRRHRFRHEGLLGTSVDIVIRSRRAAARSAERFVLAEIARMQARYSAYESNSELSRWADGRLADADTTDEFRELLDLAQRWQRDTAGVFNPLAGRALRRWAEAEQADELPTDAELRSLAAAIARPAFTVAVDVAGRRTVTRTGTPVGFQLNALAKGWIVDKVFEAAQTRFDLSELVISVGGDLRAVGRRPVRVSIEDPAAARNGVALTTVSMLRGALATSGGAHRFVRVGGRRYSHLIDPRTARPVDHIASASVVASDLATADVIATALTILEPIAGVELADRHGVACSITTVERQPFTNAAWDRLDTAPNRR